MTALAHFHKHVHQICDEALEWFHFDNYSELIFIGEQEGSLEASPLCLYAGAQYLISAINRQAVHSIKGSTIYRVSLTTGQGCRLAPRPLLKEDMIPNRVTHWELRAHSRMAYSLLN